MLQALARDAELLCELLLGELLRLARLSYQRAGAAVILVLRSGSSRRHARTVRKDFLPVTASDLCKANFICYAHAYVECRSREGAGGGRTVAVEGCGASA